MTIYRITPEGTGDGSSWENSLSPTTYNSSVRFSLTEGDTLLISKLQGENGYFIPSQFINLVEGFSGAEDNRSTVKMGGCPSANDVSIVDTEVPLFLGSNPYPFNTADTRTGEPALQMYNSHCDIIGFNSYHKTVGVYIRPSSNNVGLYETTIVNSERGIYSASDVGNIVIKGARLKDITKTGIRIASAAPNIYISDVKVDMGGIQGDAFPNGITIDTANNVYKGMGLPLMQGLSKGLLMYMYLIVETEVLIQKVMISAPQIVLSIMQIWFWCVVF